MNGSSAKEIFNVSLDRAYKFCLFYLTQLNPNPHSSGIGSISPDDLMSQFQAGHQFVLVEWDYPRRFVVAKATIPISQTELTFRETELGIEATWTFSLRSTSFLERIITAVPRWRMSRAGDVSLEARKSLLTVKQEIEHTDPGLEEAFLYFQAMQRGDGLSVEDLILEQMSEFNRKILLSAAVFNVLALNQPDTPLVNEPSLKARDHLADFAGIVRKVIQRKRVRPIEISHTLTHALQRLQRQHESGEDPASIFPCCCAWEEKITVFENSLRDLDLRQLDEYSLQQHLLRLREPTEADTRRIALQIDDHTRARVRQTFHLWADRSYLIYEDLSRPGGE